MTKGFLDVKYVRPTQRSLCTALLSCLVRKLLDRQKLQNTTVTNTDMNVVFSIAYYVLNYIQSWTINDPVDPLYLQHLKDFQYITFNT